ncbi:hypothetical protein [Roseomonas sp. AR75]|uniref:hypothetical protein n=1 Tax=Roseomonas sp. AR75 TaxID=2562311 RepID=UPI0010C012B7|nr:hypothetical protein [Roseomonas sp. AR75]
MGDADDSTMQLVRAKEALRQVEQRLAAQATTLATLETRATSLVGWALAGLVAGGAALVTPAVPTVLAYAAAGLIAALLASAVTAALAIAPRDWGVQGHLPRDVIGDFDESEAKFLEWLAEGLGKAAEDNRQRITDAARRLQISLLWFIAAAPLGFVSGVIAWARTALD